MKKANLENAAQLAIQYPNSFERPSASRLQSLKKGDIVKVCASGERFWVTVTGVSGTLITGVIDNKLVNTSAHGLTHKDTIEFTTDHIYSIYN